MELCSRVTLGEVAACSCACALCSSSSRWSTYLLVSALMDRRKDMGVRFVRATRIDLGIALGNCGDRSWPSLKAESCFPVLSGLLKVPEATRAQARARFGCRIVPALLPISCRMPLDWRLLRQLPDLDVDFPPEGETFSASEDCEC